MLSGWLKMPWMRWKRMVWLSVDATIRLRAFTSVHLLRFMTWGRIILINLMRRLSMLPTLRWKALGKTRFSLRIWLPWPVTWNCWKMLVSLCCGVRSTKLQASGSGGEKTLPAIRLCGLLCSTTSRLRDWTIWFGFGLLKQVMKIGTRAISM